MGVFAQAIVKEKINNNTFIIQTNQPFVEVSWQVTSVRNDPYAKANRVEAEKIKDVKGTYVHPELYNQDKSKVENAVQPQKTEKASGADQN